MSKRQRVERKKSVQSSKSVQTISQVHYDSGLQWAFDVDARVRDQQIKVKLRQAWTVISTQKTKGGRGKSRATVHCDYSLQRDLVAKVNDKEVILPASLLRSNEWILRDGVLFWANIDLMRILEQITLLPSDCARIIYKYDGNDDHINFSSVLTNELELRMDVPFRNETLPLALFQFVSNALPFDIWLVDSELGTKCKLSLGAIKVSRYHSQTVFVRLESVYVATDQIEVIAGIADDDNESDGFEEDEDTWIIDTQGLVLKPDRTLTELEIGQKASDNQRYCKCCCETHLGMCSRKKFLGCVILDPKPFWLTTLQKSILSYPTQGICLLSDASFEWVMPHTIARDH